MDTEFRLETLRQALRSATEKAARDRASTSTRQSSLGLDNRMESLEQFTNEQIARELQAFPEHRMGSIEKVTRSSQPPKPSSSRGRASRSSKKRRRRSKSTRRRIRSRSTRRRRRIRSRSTRRRRRTRSKSTRGRRSLKFTRDGRKVSLVARQALRSATEKAVRDRASTSNRQSSLDNRLESLEQFTQDQIAHELQAFPEHRMGSIEKVTKDQIAGELQVHTAREHAARDLVSASVIESLEKFTNEQIAAGLAALDPQAVYEVEYCFESLVGRWRDQHASLYEVSVDKSEVTICTTRRNGEVLVNDKLVKRDAKSGWITWGRDRRTGSRYLLSKLDSRSIKWEKQHAADFVWSRVGECPVRPKSEKDRGASSSTVAQGRQSRSQKGVIIIKWRRVRRSQARSRCRAASPSAAAAVAHSTLRAECSRGGSPQAQPRRKLGPPPLVGRPRRKLGPPPLVGRPRRKLGPPPLVMTAAAVEVPLSVRLHLLLAELD